jgi:hypothetical protein
MAAGPSGQPTGWTPFAIRRPGPEDGLGRGPGQPVSDRGAARVDDTGGELEREPRALDPPGALPGHEHLDDVHDLAVLVEKDQVERKAHSVHVHGVAPDQEDALARLRLGTSEVAPQPPRPGIDQIDAVSEQGALGSIHHANDVH